MEQRTEEWLQERIGHLTASRLADALDKTAKGADGAKRANYRMELVAERLTHKQAAFFENDAMRWGTECEPLARLAYEARTGRLVEEVGFIKHPEINWLGASPDGLIDDDGLIEIKCPTSQTHVAWMLEDKVPDKHKLQMILQLACTQRKWCDFVSYDPRFPDDFKIFIKRFMPTEEEISVVIKDCVEFLNSIDSTIKKLYSRF